MTEIDNTISKRKILSLKKDKQKDPEEQSSAPKFLLESIFMVWCPEGEMPKRVYQKDEKSIAISHAKKLTEQTGKRFYVMRSWRGFDPK